MSAHVRYTGEPGQCRCTRIIVSTLEETLDCPDGWRLVPGTGWIHSWPPRRRTRREAPQAAS